MNCADCLPPHSPDAEAGVLGCILVSPADYLPEVRETLGDIAEIFYDLRHQTIFEAMLSLEVDGIPIDLISLQERLKSHGLLEQCGGVDYLSVLPDATPSAANLSYWADIVREKFLLRKMIHTCTVGVERIYGHEGSPTTLLADLQQDFERLSRITKSARYVPRSIGEIEMPAADDPEELIKYRFLCRGGAMLLPAPSGVGKTVIAIQMMLCFAVGRECLGFRPARPLRSLYIQAENDDSDLREIRDGILAGLHFNEAERKQALENVRFVTVDDLCGPDFIRLCIEPLCDSEKPDLLWIDPLLSYIGGDISRQEVVSPWLRNHLNPVLHKHRVGCVLIHHTNKPPTGKEKSIWQAGDFAYLGTGSSELANWPRAVVAIRSVGSHEVFELRLAKRGRRAGWENPDGSPRFSRFIAHGRDGIYWRDAEPEEIPGSPGRKATHTVEDILEALEDGELLTTQWQQVCKTEFGVSERNFYRLKKEASTKGLVQLTLLTQKWSKSP